MNASSFFNRLRRQFLLRQSFAPDALRAPRVLAIALSLGLGALILFGTATVSLGSDYAVLTQHNDNHRSGANLTETNLNVSNVRGDQFGLLFERHVEGKLYAQPLFYPHLRLSDGSIHNVIIAATSQNNVYAFDADDASLKDPLWKVSLDDALKIPDKKFGGDGLTVMAGEVGILSTPVIDASSQIIYIVCFNAEHVYKIHQLQLSSGEEVDQALEIAGALPGTGAGSNGSMVAFNPLVQVQRSSLLLANDKVYISFGARGGIFGDVREAHGWVFSYDIKAKKVYPSFISTPNADLGGIWMSGQGPASDEGGHVYLTTGNGNFSGHKDGANWGSSTLKLTDGADGILHVANDNQNGVDDFFTPHNANILNKLDLDIGSSGPLYLNSGLFSSMPVIIVGSKEGKIYVMKSEDLSGFHRRDHVTNSIWGTNKSFFRFFHRSPAEWYKNIHGAPIYWEVEKNGVSHGLLYIMGEESKLKAFSARDNDLGFNKKPAHKSNEPTPKGMPGGMLALSAFGHQRGTGIVWVTHPKEKDANKKVVEGVLEAYNAEDVSELLWSSKAKTEDNVGNFAKFAPVTVANGMVYVPTFSNGLKVYGLKKKTP